MIYAIIYFSVLLVALVVIGFKSASVSDSEEIMLRVLFCGLLWPATLTACIIYVVLCLPVKIGKWLRERLNIGKYK